MEQQDPHTPHTPHTPERRGRKVARVVVTGVKLVASQLIAWLLREWLG